MRNFNRPNTIFIILGVLLVSISSFSQNDGNWHINHLDSIPVKETKVYVDTPTISGETFHIDTVSILKASKYDRMLFIIEGNCIASLKSKTLDSKTGDVIFLKANESIQFSGNSKMMLWTSKSTKTMHKYETEKFTKAQIEANRNSLENVWYPFIETSTMVTGLYMLPKSLDGDNTLAHEFDEINYVINGTAKFRMHHTVIDVGPGSIMWVKRGVGHYFYDLSDDFDVFILFETIHMNHEH